MAKITRIMAINDKVGKWDFFKQVTGHDYWDRRDRWQAQFAGDIPDFEIPKKRVDQIYLLAQKLKRCYEPDDGRLTCKYYVRAISEVEKAYTAGDIASFRTAVRDLVAAISAD